MFNPQMMGNSLPDIPSVKELWKNEKKQYRHWIILLGVGLLIIFALILTSFILNLLDKANIVDKLAISYLDANEKKTMGEAITFSEAFFNRQYLIFPIVELLFLVGGIVAYGATIFQSYREHNFAKISSWPTLIIGVAAFFSGWQLIEILFIRGQSVEFYGAGEVFSFVSNILFIIIYFFASAPVSRVRRLFIASTKMEQIKNDPQYQAMQTHFQQMMGGMAAGGGAFGPSHNNSGQKTYNQPNNNNQNGNAKTANQQGAAQGANNPQVVQPVQPQISPEEKKLRDMSLQELKEVAKRFSLSGYSQMSKQELIDAILRITGKK